ncbi:hypothetical protein GH714_020812 [Hevea brasiliensis]|uniref:RRM domain-containing protein n=1 Tax=Hevea brasiliensis TaxID=3981 RepID=A0A6A6KTF6_HEVBR|nr:hypothetical protein GH714_020812 [Hevea brasiliensis]
MVLFLLILSSIFSGATAQQRTSNISLGIWFAKIQQKTVIWTANRDDPPLPNDVTLSWSSDGRLILQLNQGQQIPIAEGSQPAFSASMLDSDTYTAGENVSLNLDSNGHLYLLNATGFNIKILKDKGTISGNLIYCATVDVDGIFRLYSHNLDQYGNWSIEWWSSDNKCYPIGLCGVNAYCTLVDQGTSCACPPGFDFIDQGQKNLRCQRNSSNEDCKSFRKSNYIIQELEAVSWEDNPYAKFQASTETECREDCLTDGNCEAALYKNQECRKQRLPLRFGRTQRHEPMATFFKDLISVLDPVFICLQSSGLPSSHEIHNYYPRDDDDDHSRHQVVKDTKTIGSAYDRYLQNAQITFSSGEASGLSVGLGRPNGNARTDLPVFNSGIVGRPRASGPYLAPNGRDLVFRRQPSVDTMDRPVRETVPLPPDASSTLYVEGLPPDSTRREVAHIFRPFVGYKEVRLVSKEFKHRGDPIILCFVDFENPACAATALSALQGYQLDEHDRESNYLRLEFSRYPGPRSGHGSRGRR